MWVHNSNALIYCSLETKPNLEDWKDDRVYAQEGAQILGSKINRHSLRAAKRFIGIRQDVWVYLVLKTKNADVPAG